MHGKEEEVGKRFATFCPDVRAGRLSPAGGAKLWLVGGEEVATVWEGNGKVGGAGVGDVGGDGRVCEGV